MGDRNLTTEQLRAIERWENEGGKVSPALRMMSGRQIEIMRNELPARRNLSYDGKTGAGKRPMYGQDGDWYCEAH